MINQSNYTAVKNGENGNKKVVRFFETGKKF